MKVSAFSLLLSLVGSSASAVQRRLEDEAANGYNFDIDPTDVINFKQCTTLSVGIDDNAAEIMLDEDVVGYTKEGDLTKIISEVTFTVTKEDGTVEERVSSVQNYLQILSQGALAQIEAYCEVCEEMEDNCNGNNGRTLEEEGGDDDQADDGQGVTYVSCDQCAAYGCFEEDEDNGDDDAANNWDYEADEVSVGYVAEWVNGISQCQQLENGAWNNFNLYASFMCANDGEGFMMGVFLDEECSVHFSLESFYAIAYGTDDFGPYQQKDDFLEGELMDGFDCDKKYFANPYAGNEEENEEEDNEEGDEADVCQQLYAYSVPLDTCEAEYQQENDENENDNENDDGDVDYSSIYEPMISVEDAQDAEAVCLVIQELDGALGYTFDMVEDDSEAAARSQHGGRGMDTWSLVATLVFSALILAFSIFCFNRKQGKIDNEADKSSPLV